MDSCPPAYAELHCLTNFSFLRGASHPQELVGARERARLRALAITDECSLAGVVRAHMRPRRRRAAAASCIDRQRVHARLTACGCVLLARNREGYGNLCELITRGAARSAKGSYRSARRRRRVRRRCCASRDCRDSAAGAVAPAPRAARGGAGRAGCAHLPAAAPGSRSSCCRTADDALLRRLRASSAPQQRPAAGRRRRRAHARALAQAAAGHADRHPPGKPVAECGFALQPNAEQHLRSRCAWRSSIRPSCSPNAGDRARCDFSLDELRYEYPDELVPRGQTPASLPARADRGRRARALPAGHARGSARADRARAGADRRSCATSPTS